MNSTIANIGFGILWFFAGMLYAFFFMRSITAVTKMIQPEKGFKVVFHIAAGGLVRFGGIAALLYFALRMNIIFALLTVAGFSVVNIFQIISLAKKKAGSIKQKDIER